MEIDHLHNLYTGEPLNNIFSDDFVCSSVMEYFRRLGYKVQKNVSLSFNGKEEKLVTASTFFRKELIEIKGCYPYSYGAVGEGHPTLEARSSVSSSIISSFANIGNYYRDENLMASIAVPNVPRFRAIVDRLQYYFTENDLYYKVYLVNENGEISVFHLNEQTTRK